MMTGSAGANQGLVEDRNDANALTTPLLEAEVNDSITASNSAAQTQTDKENPQTSLDTEAPTTTALEEATPNQTILQPDEEARDPLSLESNDPNQVTRNNPENGHTTSVADHELERDTATCFLCARFTLGLLYWAISAYMVFLLVVGQGLDNSFGTGRGLCHAPSLCLFVLSWAAMAAYLGVEGTLVFCFGGTNQQLGYRQRRSILKALRPTLPLAIFIVYLLVAYLYLDIRNHIVYDGKKGDDKNDDDAMPPANEWDDDDSYSTWAMARTT